MLFSAVCLLLLLSHGNAQVECDEIQASDLAGAVAFLLSDIGNSPDVLVTNSNTVCLAASTNKNKYYFASVIATYDCGGAASVLCPPGPYPRTDQFEFGCMNSNSGPFWGYSNFPNDSNIPVNPSNTMLRKDCWICISPAGAAIFGLPDPVDPETHCGGMFTPVFLQIGVGY